MVFSRVTGPGNRFQYQYSRQVKWWFCSLVRREAEGETLSILFFSVPAMFHVYWALIMCQIPWRLSSRGQWLEDTSTNYWSLYSRREYGCTSLLWIFSLSVFPGRWGPHLFFSVNPNTALCFWWTCLTVSYPQISSVGKVLLSYPFYKWGNWGLEKWSCLKLFEPK